MPLCPECDFDFDTSAQEKLQINVRVPQRACQLTEMMGDAVYTRRGPTVWSPNEYIWHMADMFHAGTEMLHAAQVQDHPTIVVPNGDLLAQARDYSVLSLETGLWSLSNGPLDHS